MPSTRLILVAHLPTSATRLLVFATGREPLEADALAAARIHRGVLPPASDAFVSPAPVARLTAEALGLEAESCPVLRDVDVGHWTGRVIDEIASTELAAWRADPRYAGHGGESLAALIERVTDFLGSRLNARGQTIAITHASVVRAALVSALGAPAKTFWHVDAPPLGAMALSSNGRRWSLRRFGPLPAVLEC